MSSGKRILVVSQNGRFLHAVENNLANLSFQVSSTKARDEALLKVLVDIIPDLTILDTPLAAMSGIKELLGIRGTMDTPVMLLSTQGAKADTVRTLSLGSCNHPVIKPLTFEQLMSQINSLLNKN